MLEIFVPAEDEVQEDDGDDADDKLKDPDPEGDVDVHDVALFPVAYHFRLEQTGRGRLRTISTISQLLQKSLSILQSKIYFQ